MAVPRWGIQEGIKYSPRRSILKVCPICNKFFLQVSRGKKKYCSDICYLNAEKILHRIRNNKMIDTRDKLYHADYMRELYNKGRLSKNKRIIGTDSVPAVPIKKDGSMDWKEYHKLLHNKCVKLGITTL